MATANLGRVGFVNKGTYSGVTTYKVNDVVTYNSGTYACIQANTGQAPTNTSYWQNWVADNAVHKTGDETIAGVKTFSNNLVFASGTKIQGDFSNATVTNRPSMQSSTVDGKTFFDIFPNGTATQTAISLHGKSDALNDAQVSLSINTARTLAFIYTSTTGTGVAPDFAILANGGGSGMLFKQSDKSFTSVGGGGIGYGTGSGGTVTQLTSKATDVTLNKPCGQITMHNAALAAGASVEFILNNTNIASYSLVSVNPIWGAASYKTEVTLNTTGAVVIRVTNITLGSLSDALSVRFNVILGATA